MRLNKRILKYVIVLAVTGILLAIAIVGYVMYKPKRNISKTKVEYTLSATELHRQFIDDEQTANAKYLSAAYGKVIRVTGTVGEISESGTHTTITLREPGTVDGGVSCSMAVTETEKVKELTVGDKVSIKGECTGYLDITNEVTMVKCLFED